MNGLIAKIFGFLLSITSILALVFIVYVVAQVNPQALGLANGGGWVLGLLSGIIYVIVMGSLAVLAHTRELAERQVELLEQIQFQLMNRFHPIEVNNFKTKQEPT